MFQAMHGKNIVSFELWKMHTVKKLKNPSMQTFVYILFLK